MYICSYPDSKIQEHAVTALLNLSIDDEIKKQVSKEGPIPAIIEILQNGTVGAKENSAAALFSLSMLDENKVLIGSSNGIPPLVNLLTEGTIRGKRCSHSFYGVYEHVSEISQFGTKRGKKKAMAILQLMSKRGQIPSYNNVRLEADPA
ncbi:U-box domain-containing protein 15-like protein [Tanacetum coccineum]